MTTINRWRVYCITEDKFVYGYLEKGLTCTSCFTDTNHLINASSISIDKEIVENVTLISTNDNSQIGGNYINEYDSFEITSGIDVVTTHIKTFYYDIGVLSFSLDFSNENIGDIFDIDIRPRNDSPVGVTTSDIISGSTSINVGSSVVYFKKGFYIKITDGVHLDTRLIIDINDTILTLDNGINNSYNAGSYIKFFIKRVKNFKVMTAGYRNFANFLRTSNFPVSMESFVRYVNKSNVPKTFTYGVEYLY